MTPTLALIATLCHTLALSGSLLLSHFAYTVLDRLSGPLLGSQRRCHADALSPALTGNDINIIILPSTSSTISLTSCSLSFLPATGVAGEAGVGRHKHLEQEDEQKGDRETKGRHLKGEEMEK